jgi:hypothetical protein
MKSFIAAIAFVFIATTSHAQSLTCRPMPNGTTVCAPTPASGGAGIGPALVVVVVLYFVIKFLQDRPADNKDQDQQ